MNSQSAHHRSNLPPHLAKLADLSWVKLTRQVQFVAYMHRFYSIAQIAEMLVISENTVKRHLAKTREELDVHSIAHALTLITILNLIDQDVQTEADDLIQRWWMGQQE